MDPAQITGLFNAASDHIPGIVAVIATIVTACATIASVTPTKVDDAILSGILRIINVLALNVGKAKNADDLPKPQGPDDAGA